MKSFAKVSLLFGLIVLGRYLQPTAPAPTLAFATAGSTPALPSVLTRYVALSPKQLPYSYHYNTQPAQGYFL
ncbi:MAG: hypothetical protein EOO63_12495 [Hymenobacter sp.]|nr:MAG: hypothetical protein EOO63_12495 [Hymenobacter sp.]